MPLEPKVIVEMDQYDLRQRPLHSKDSLRPKRKAASNINYGIMDATSEEEELIISVLAFRDTLPSKLKDNG